jgi:ankyrin repeat protein
MTAVDQTREIAMIRKMGRVLAVLMLTSAGTVAAIGQDAPAAGSSEERSTRLQDAVAAGNLAEFEAMLSAGADPNRVDPGGKTAVHRAAFADDPRFLEVILAHGGDPNARGSAGTTPLTDAILAPSLPVEKIKVLLSAGADPNAADPNGGTPLHTAARTNNGKAILALLEAGASPLAETGGTTFQTLYFGYDRSLLNDEALADRGAVVEWLQQNGIPIDPNAGAE